MSLLEEMCRLDYHHQNDDCEEFQWIEYYCSNYYDDDGNEEEPYPMYGTVPKSWTEDNFKNNSIFSYMTNIRFVEKPSRKWCIKNLKILGEKISGYLKAQEELTKMINEGI